METNLILFKTLSDLHILLADLYSQYSLCHNETRRAAILAEINKAYTLTTVLRNVRF